MPPKIPSAELKRKQEEAAEANALKAAKTEKVEPETDAADDSRARVKESVQFVPDQTTLNVVPAMESKVLMCLCEGGMQYLIAGARANVGMKAGRYMYEVSILESLNTAEQAGRTAPTGRAPTPKQLVRVGFSTSAAGLVLGDSEESICFDSEGALLTGKQKKTGVAKRFTRGEVLGVVLNMDNNTVSLFRGGERISDPQTLPPSMQGKVLYPHVAFRSVTVQMHFGPTPEKALPFSCRMLQDAAQADVHVQPSVVSSNGKCDLVVPVGFPDEGTFEWLDGFFARNPSYVELSDRSIQAWATSSGLAKPPATAKSSNDKPEFNYGLPGMDDGSVRKSIFNMAPTVPRNYVVMEVKSNLVAEERQECLERFSSHNFKKLAYVIMGEATDEFRNAQLERRLVQKQKKSDAEFAKKQAAKKAEALRKKQVALRQKQLAEQKRKAEAAKKRAAELAKRKKEAKEQGIAEEDMEPMEEEPEEPLEEEEPEEMEEDDERPPEVELTEEEKQAALKKRPGALPDLTEAVVNKCFSKFSVPEKEEGFDELKYEWQNASDSKEYLKKWVSERKRTAKIEDLQPGEWFKEKLGEWLKTYATWQSKHKEYANSHAKKAKDAERKKKEEAARKAEEAGEDIDEEAEDEVDIFLVEDVKDVGNGAPLFADFAMEDWALLQLRMELYYLQAAFRKDVDDPERSSIPDAHIAYYYNKYFKKTLNPKNFGKATNSDLCVLVKDTVKIDEAELVLSSVLADEPDSFDMFVKLTEENRRERKRRIEAGDESQKLKVLQSACALPQVAKAAPGLRPSLMK